MINLSLNYDRHSQIDARKMDESSKQLLCLILDNAPYNTSGETLLFWSQNSRRLEFFLPKYAPELNPAELMWAHFKNHGMNKVFVRNRNETRPHNVNLETQRTIVSTNLFRAGLPLITLDCHHWR